MYLRKKRITKEHKGEKKIYTYYYLVEYSNEEGKIKQKMVAYLGNAEKIKKMFDIYKEHKTRDPFDECVANYSIIKCFLHH